VDNERLKPEEPDNRVREYWLIDPEARTVEVLYLEAGEYELVARWHSGEDAQSRLLKGFAVPVAPLFVER
jgi:Uma2 family endonuclease